VMHVGGAVAFRTVVGVVKVQLVLVATKAAVLGAIGRQIVVNPSYDRIAVATLNERSRQGPAGCAAGVAGAVGPHRIWALEGRRTVAGAKDALVGGTGTQREDVPLLGEKLSPALMREGLSRRPPLHGTPPRQLVHKVRFMGASGRGGVIRVIGQTRRQGFVGVGRTAKLAIALGAAKDRPRRDRGGALQVQAIYGLVELLGAVEWAPWRAGWHLGKGALGKGT